MGFLKKLSAFAAVIASYVQTGAAGAAPDAVIFNNPTGSGETFEVLEVSSNYDVAGGAAAAADLKITASGTAIAGGTSALASAIDLTAAARTIRKATLSTTKSSRLVKPGYSLVVDTSGTLTGLTGLGITVTLQPLTRKIGKG